MRFTRTVDGQRLAALRGLRSREVIAHELRSRGHATDAKAIWRWENGRNQPNARILPDYAEALGAASVDELYSDAEDDEEAASMQPTQREVLETLYGALGLALGRERESA